MNNRFVRLVLAGSLAMFALTRPAVADIYPSRAITIVVPNAAGGPTDAIARSVGQKLSTRLGQPVLIDNRGGAGGTIAAEFVARSKPDGYTLLLSTTGTLAINPALFRTLRYDAARDFDPVCLLSTTSNALVVRSDLPVRDVKELVGLAKREPERLTYGSSGNGASNHLSAELFKSMTGIQIRHIPYKAASPLRVDLHEGRIDMVFAPEGAAFKELSQDGKTRIIMVSGKTRSTLMPSVPTAEEVGLKGYDVSIWFGLNAPAGTSSAILERLNKEVNAILATPEMKQELASDGQVARPLTVPQYGSFLNEERLKWLPVVKASGARLD